MKKVKVTLQIGDYECSASDSCRSMGGSVGLLVRCLLTRGLDERAAYFRILLELQKDDPELFDQECKRLLKVEAE